MDIQYITNRIKANQLTYPNGPQHRTHSLTTKPRVFKRHNVTDLLLN